MLTTISDNPGLSAAAVGVVTTFVALLVAFGVHLSPEQVQALLAFVVALFALVAIVARIATVPRTPSSASPALLQVPPDGTVLVTSAAAAAAGPVPAGDVVAAPRSPEPPQP